MSSAKTTRVHIDLPPDIAAVMAEMADRRGVSRTTLVRIALGVLQAADKGAERGMSLILTKQREDDDRVLVAPL